MTEHESPLSPFGARWAQAVSRCEPAFDETPSQERWLAAFARPRPARRWRRGYLLAAAAVLCSVVLAVTLPRVGLLAGDAAESGASWAGATVQTEPGQVLPLEFGEGSRVSVQGGSRLRVTRVDAEGAELLLESGKLNASIVHRSNTRWSFRSGPFQVRVTGTSLSLSWRPDRQQFEVHVTEGSVWVVGPMLESGRSIAAGQRCAVRIREARLEVTRAEDQDGEIPHYDVAELPLIPSAEPGEPPAASVALPSSHALGWHELERQGKYPEAISAARALGLESIYGSGSPDELMSLARAARLSGHAGLAERALVVCRARFPGDPQASTAAFLLGRSASPREAARWFATYLREAPGGALAREAAGRLIEAHQGAGNVGAAERAARSYLDQYPNGPHASFARGILEAHTSRP